MALRFTDGTTATDLSEPLQGMRHRILFGIEASSGREVAAKIELIAGALAPELRALKWLTEQDGPAPRLLAAGTLDDSGEYPGAVCLVVPRVAGERPTTLESWNRLGRALARLSLIPWGGSGLTTLDHDAFRDLHERRVADLGEALGRDLGASLPPLPRAYASSPMTVTHGDPGPGNFLDDGAAGTLIDWEDAVVAPRGLDLGRARFIALLGVGPEGWVAEEPAARADAVTAGFLGEVESQPDEDDLAWWLAVAGVQFAHRRLERAGALGVLPWLDAVTALESALPASD
ncbi:MAG TPA: aminoglycoside phosphotransferase family protein [Solirubrobacterales bacterium]|jgi:aminoglycoside phosphotransferase (APT) family kinase protein|nr:aminoglycoside phosphotransferase family protein [Solirubrobacterales bacterium]